MFSLCVFLSVTLLVGCDRTRRPLESMPLAETPVHGAVVEVASVTDGDTFRARYRDGSTQPVRLQGLDCPEVRRNSTCRRIEKEGGLTCEQQLELGHQASDVARELLPEKSRVVLESAEGEGPLPRGGFGRSLAYARLPDGRDFGEVMVRRTECVDFEKYPHPRSKIYKAAQKESIP